MDRAGDNDLSSFSSEELVSYGEALYEFEQARSHERRELFTRIDALSAELVRRYRDGEANVDGLLAPTTEARLVPSMRDDLDKRFADVGDFIKSQREVARMSVRRLAELAGVSNPYLSQIERGCASRRPRSCSRSPRR